MPVLSRFACSSSIVTNNDAVTVDIIIPIIITVLELSISDLIAYL